VEINGQQLLDMEQAIPALTQFLLSKGEVMLARDLGLIYQKLQPAIATYSGIKLALLRQYGKEEKGQVTVQYGTSEYQEYMKAMKPVLEKAEPFDVAPVKMPGRVLVGLPGIVFLTTLPLLEIENEQR